MPHATETSVNGQVAQSQFINHLTSYPVVNDSIETFKANAYGKKSIEIVDGVYNRFGKPFVPYLQTPYSYAEPYVKKADALADSGLDRVDSNFPIVKEDTNTIIETGKGYALWPYTYLSSTWNDEYTKTAKYNNRGPGLTTGALAVVSTELKIASDFFHVLADILGPKYEESKQKGLDYVHQAQSIAQHYNQVGQEKLNAYAKFGHAKVNEGQKVAGEKIEQAKQEAQ